MSQETFMLNLKKFIYIFYELFKFVFGKILVSRLNRHILTNLIITMLKKLKYLEQLIVQRHKKFFLYTLTNLKP